MLSASRDEALTEGASGQQPVPDQILRPMQRAPATIDGGKSPRYRHCRLEEQIPRPSCSKSPAVLMQLPMESTVPRAFRLSLIPRYVSGWRDIPVVFT